MDHISANGSRAGHGPDVEFLDCGEAPCGELIAAIDTEIDSLPDDGILTVYSSRAGAKEAVEAHCATARSMCTVLVATIAHSGGTTFVIRRITER